MTRDQVFISYSHKDKKWREELETHLKPFLRYGIITSWSDQQIEPGSKWFEEIHSALTNSRLAVLLVSPDFLASDFIHKHELGPLLKRAEQGGVQILWIPIYISAYKQTPLKDDQALNDPGNPLAEMRKAKRNRAWVEICEKIQKVGEYMTRALLSPVVRSNVGELEQDRVWNQQIWDDIDKAAREVVGSICVARKVFPSIHLQTWGLNAKPFTEIAAEFLLTQRELDGKENVRLARSRARRAASLVANAEDTILFLGPGSIPFLPGVAVTNQLFLEPGSIVAVTNQPPAPHQLAIPPQFATIPPGFVAEAAAYPPPINVLGATPLGAPPTPPPFVGDIKGAVAQGMANLNAKAQPGPYALFVPPNRYAQAFAPISQGSPQTPGDLIKHVVTGGFYSVTCLAVPPPLPSPPPFDIGILVSLGGEPTRIIIGIEATTAFTYIDPEGNYHFRVFERIQMVMEDGRAFQTLRFGEPTHA